MWVVRSDPIETHWFCQNWTPAAHRSQFIPYYIGLSEHEVFISTDLRAHLLLLDEAVGITIMFPLPYDVLFYLRI